MLHPIDLPSMRPVRARLSVLGLLLGMATLLTMPMTAGAQGFVPRAQPAGPQGMQPQPGYQPGYPQQGYQPGYPQPGMGYQPQPQMSVVDPDKKLSAGDQVTLEIVEDRAGGFPRVVTATGELDVPPLGKVRVSGKTATDAAASIKQLLERDYYYTATVRLSIDQVSKGIVQQGSVQLSGQVRMVGPQMLIAGESLTVTGALLKAGGLTEWGNARKVQVARQNKDGTTEKFEVDFKKITETGDVRSDPILQDGDRIFVPKVIVRF
jgi:protein involved in polysaccharide export with SLBB domain